MSVTSSNQENVHTNASELEVKLENIHVRAYLSKSWYDNLVFNICPSSGTECKGNQHHLRVILTSEVC